MSSPAGQTDRAVTGIVFNVQRYSVHDGAGIRTLVFLKGCPLTCRWCSNPESQRRVPEIGLNARRCLGVETCDYCADACGEGALRLPERGPPEIDRDACTACGVCAERCPAGALALYGRSRSVGDVIDEVERDSAFYARSDGGMTLSGGEPLAQAGFALALLREARRRRIDTAIETCGAVPWETLAAAAELAREIQFDVKAADPNLHAAWTGSDNRQILANLDRLATAFPDLSLTVRTPVIPGFNDTEAEIGAILALVARHPRAAFELLPYHRLGTEKYRYLDRDYGMAEATLGHGRFEALAAFAAVCGR